MPPKPEDLAMAAELAGRIVAAGRGRVRRVAMVGSRALGTARPESDLDLVVLVELAAGAPPWGPKEFQAERGRLRREAGAPPVRTDLWVRTTDRFEEARRVVGGVEWLVETEGVEVYRRPLDRPPTVRRTPGQVRRENVSAWIEHAMLALEGATARGNAAALAAGGAPAEARQAARAAVERAVNALLVSHQLRADKAGGVGEMLRRLETVEPAAAAELRSMGAESVDAALEAHRVLAAVVHRLSADPVTARYLAGPRERLGRPRIVLG